MTMPTTMKSGGVSDTVESPSHPQEMIVRVGGKFRLKERIGSGAFGS
jgi:hypothetical protein